MRPDIYKLFESTFRFSEKPTVEIDLDGVAYRLTASGSEGILFQAKKDGESKEAFVNIRPRKATATVRPAYYAQPMMLVVDKEVITYPRTKTTIYTWVPAKIQLILTSEGTEHVLDELKKDEVLRTHYGPVDGGVLCLLSYVRAFWREEEVVTDGGYGAVVPLTMVNTLESLHTMRRIVLFPDYLDLYASGGRLYTNPIAVHIMSGKEANVDYQDKSPRSSALKLVTRKAAPKAGRIVKQYFGQLSKAAQEYGL